PRGQFPDHWQFRKLMRLPDFRGATSRRMTALQFPTTADGRDAWDAEARVQELVPWHALGSSPGAQVEVDRLVREGTLAQLIEARGQLSVNARDVDVLRRDLTGQVDTLRAE